MEEINDNLQKKIEILKSQCEDLIEQSEIIFALKYSKEDKDVLYDGQLWTRLQLDKRILGLIENLQNRFVIKNRINIADEKLRNIIKNGSRHNLNFNDKDQPKIAKMDSPLLSNRSQISRNAKLVMDNLNTSVDHSQK